MRQRSFTINTFSGFWGSFPSSVFHFILLLPWLKGIKPCPQPYSLQWNTHTHRQTIAHVTVALATLITMKHRQTSNQTPSFNPVVLNRHRSHGGMYRNTSRVISSEGEGSAPTPTTIHYHVTSHAFFRPQWISQTSPILLIINIILF